jgi:G3E family GTPase
MIDGPRLLGEFATYRLDAPVTPREVLLAHQIAEAPVLLVSKCDLLNESEQDAARDTLAKLNPRARIITTSAYAGSDVDELVSTLRAAGPITLPDPVAIDYETYAQAEAEMGWLNGHFELESEEGFFPDEVATEIALRLNDEPGLEVLHAKILCVGSEASTKVSLVGGRIQADEALPATEPLNRAGVIVNVRAATSADALASIIDSLVNALPDMLPVLVTGYERRALTPAPPVPEHRIGRDGQPID